MKLNEVVTELQKYNQIINTNKIGAMSGDDVSKLVLKLASYNTTLGEGVAEAERAADFAEASYELKKEQAYKQARSVTRQDPKGKLTETTVADADNFKRLESQDEKGAWIEAKYSARLLLLLHNDTKELIGAARSRLSFLKHDQEQSR